MKWPLMWRSTHEGFIAALSAELEAERKRARRRERRRKLVQPLEREVPVTQSGPDLPEEVLQAIDERAGLRSRAGAQMMAAAEKALASGKSAAAVAAWMYDGEPDE